MNKNTYIGMVVAILVLGGAWYAYQRVHTAPPALPVPVTYACLSGGTITAAYRDDQVDLTLSDGRTFTLSQVVSASGIRYELAADNGQHYVFASKGDDAFFMENDVQTYANCLANAAPGTIPSGMKTFMDSGSTFQFSYPSDLTVSGGGAGYDTNWSAGSAGRTGLLLAQVTVPRSFQPETNFSEARFIIGTSADPQAVNDCISSPSPTGNPATKSTVTVNRIPFTKFVTSDAGAGNFYETTTYRALWNDQCYSVEYTIHSTNLANYSPDQGISAFDKEAVLRVLEGMVQSFRFM